MNAPQDWLDHLQQIIDRCVAKSEAEAVLRNFGLVNAEVVHLPVAQEVEN